MKAKIIIGLSLVVIGIACAAAGRGMPWRAGRTNAQWAGAARGPIYFPQGYAEKGKIVFNEMRCHSCHRVVGHEFPEPVAEPEVPVVLGPSQACQCRARIAESIIAPSHYIPEHLPNVRSGSLSRMGDYSDAMTVRQLIDLVSFVESLNSPVRTKG